MSEGELRIGLGVDAHALEDGVPLVLGGVRVDSAARARRPLRRRRDRPRPDRRDPRRRRTSATSARSSPPTGARRRGCRRSSCSRTPTRASAPRGWELVNADCVFIGQEPRLAPLRDEMRAALAGALGVDAGPHHGPRDDDRRARFHRARRGARRAGRRIDSSGLDSSAPHRILEPVEREVELLRRVVELLVHLRDRPAQRRERGDDVAVADLRHLEQRRAAVLRVRPAPDLTPRLEPAQVRGQCRRAACRAARRAASA